MSRKIEYFLKTTIGQVFFFAFFFILAIFLSQKIDLPFHNPWNVSGPLVNIRYNPLNNILRFVFIVFFPMISYISARKFIWKTKFLNEIGSAGHKKTNELENGNTLKERFPKYFLLLVFILFLFVYFGHTTYQNPPLDTFHEGETLGMAIDYQNGKIPYKDTVFLHGVFQDPLRSILAFKLFGTSIASARFLYSIIKMITISLFFLTIFAVFDFEIIAGVFSATLLFTTINNYYSAIERDFSTFLCMMAVILFYNYFIKKSVKHEMPKNLLKFFCLNAFLAAFFPTSSFANSIDRGFFSFFGFFVFLALGFIIFFKNRKLFRSFTLSSIFGFLAGIIIVEIAVKGALWDFFDFTFRIMPSYKDLMDSFVYSFYGRRLVPVILFSGISFWLGSRFYGDFFNNGNTGYLDKARIFARNYFLEIYLFSLTLAYYRSALGRSDFGHIIDATAPLLILAVYIAVKRFIGIHWTNTRQFFATTCIILAIVSITNLSKFDAFFGKDWWKFSNSIKDEELIPQNHKKTISFLEKNLKDDQYFVTLTSEGVWYYYLKKPCPIKFPIVWFATPSFYQEEIVSEMKEKKNRIKYIIYKNNTWTNNFDFFPNEERLPIVFDYVKRNYRFCAKIDDQEIWEAKID